MLEKKGGATCAEGVVPNHATGTTLNLCDFGDFCSGDFFFVRIVGMASGARGHPSRNGQKGQRQYGGCPR